MRKRSAVLASAVLFGTLAVAGCGRVAGIPGTLEGTVLTEAQKFTLKTPEGQALSLAQLLAQKKLVLINFWATWCGYCVEEMPDLIKLQAKHEANGFTVVAVNAGESASQASSFAKKAGLNFPVALDEDMAVSQSYGLVGIPTTFLVNAEGKVLGQYNSFTPELVSDVENNL